MSETDHQKDSGRAQRKRPPSPTRETDDPNSQTPDSSGSSPRTTKKPRNTQISIRRTSSSSAEDVETERELARRPCQGRVLPWHLPPQPSSVTKSTRPSPQNPAKRKATARKPRQPNTPRLRVSYSSSEEEVTPDWKLAGLAIPPKRELPFKVTPRKKATPSVENSIHSLPTPEQEAMSYAEYFDTYIIPRRAYKFDKDGNLLPLSPKTYPLDKLFPNPFKLAKSADLTEDENDDVADGARRAILSESGQDQINTGAEWDDLSLAFKTPKRPNPRGSLSPAPTPSLSPTPRPISSRPITPPVKPLGIRAGIDKWRQDAKDIKVVPHPVDR